MRVTISTGILGAVLVTLDGTYVREGKVRRIQGENVTHIDIPGYTATKDPEPEPEWRRGYVVKSADSSHKRWLLAYLLPDNDWQLIDQDGEDELLSRLKRPLEIIAEPQYREQ
mgnify:CR=1 FL=1